MTTAKVQVWVYLDPYRLEIRSRDGKRRICGASGPEKNFFYWYDSYGTGIARTVKDNDAVATENFDLAADECIYGLGEKFIQLNKVGQTIELNMIDAGGVTTPRSYKEYSLCVSAMATACTSTFEHRDCLGGSMSACDVQWAPGDDFPGLLRLRRDIKQRAVALHDLTGKAPCARVDVWLLQSKISYKSADEVLDVARKLRENRRAMRRLQPGYERIRARLVVRPGILQTRFPYPEKFLSEMAQMGFKVGMCSCLTSPEGNQGV